MHNYEERGTFKKVFEQLMLADASSARHCHDSLRMRRNMDES